MKAFVFLLILTLLNCGKDNSITQKNVENTRVTSEQCDNQRPKTRSGSPDEPGNCLEDSDCKDGDNGRCNWLHGPEASKRFCQCDECFNDDACSNGKVCSCGLDQNVEVYIRSDSNKCVVANCITNSDCGSFSCKANIPCFHESVMGYFCTTPEDECTNDSDCGSNVSCGYSTSSQTWVCGLDGCG